MHTIEILTTGTEVVMGELCNTNAAWLAEACTALGYMVTRHVTVLDDRAMIADAVRDAATRADCVLMTGGLGPTSDDVTAAALADAVGEPLIFDETVWQQIELRCAKRGRTCPESNRQQAYRPEKSVVLGNEHGSAPGLQVALSKTTIFALPGVPQEMEAMFTEHVLPWLRVQSSRHRLSLRMMHCVGIPEAEVAQVVNHLPLGSVRVGFRAHPSHITIKLMAAAEQTAAAELELARAETKIRAALGEAIFGCGKETLAGTIGGLLLKQRATLAVAESCTGGAIANALTDIPGASAYFLGGAVTYSNAAKVAQLDVPGKLIAQHGAVSREVASAMAEGIRRHSGATYGIGVTGIAGPGGGSPEKPVGTVFIGLATPEEIHVMHECFAHSRIRFKQVVTTHTLNLLRKVLS